jgi:hypothetical protein
MMLSMDFNEFTSSFSRPGDMLRWGMCVQAGQCGNQIGAKFWEVCQWFDGSENTLKVLTSLFYVL